MSKMGASSVKGEKARLYRRFIDQLRGRIPADSPLLRHTWRQAKHNRLEASKRNIFLNFIVLDKNCRVQLYLGRKPDGENQVIFRELEANKRRIQARCCGQLSWNLRRCPTIVQQVEPNQMSDQSQWGSIQAAMIEAMVHFDAALRQYLDRYREGDLVDLARLETVEAD